MEYIVACHDPTLLAALRAFAAALALLPDPRDRRGVRHPLPVLLATLIVALAGGANSRAAVAAFTHDHQAWFRLWLPLGETTPSRDTYLRLVAPAGDGDGHGRRPCWSWSAATGAWRTACTAPWTCSSGRTTAACTRETGLP